MRPGFVRQEGGVKRWFLDREAARARARMLLIAAALLAVAALVAGLSPLDTELTRRLAQWPLVQTLKPAGIWYSNWGLYLFYLPFLFMLGRGPLGGGLLLRRLGGAYVATQLVGTTLVIHAIKLVVDRPRPFTLHPHVDPYHLSYFAEAMHSGFPSTHSVDAMVGAAFAAVLLRGRALPTAAVAAALLMATARVLIGKHYPSDVLAGLAFGAAFAWIALRFYLLPRWEPRADAAR